MTGVKRIVLGMGTGRCGTHALAQLLDAQVSACVTHEEAPLLPWHASPNQTLAPRLERFRRTRASSVVGDVASFYLPYVEEAIALEPSIRVICLKRPRDQVISSFCRWIDRVHPLPMNHWSEEPSDGMHHDPIWTRIFPQYDIQDRESGIGRYWDEYYTQADALAKRYPQQFRVFATDTALNTEAGQRDLLSFAGFPADGHVLTLESHTNRSENVRPHPRRDMFATANRRDPRRCMILVPFTSSILPECESTLLELECRGYTVRRFRRHSEVDQGRSLAATHALWQGFEETLWIDPDVEFRRETVEAVRDHDEPVVCGICPKQGRRALACHLLPGTNEIALGCPGPLLEIRYAGTGFMLIRRRVYMRMQRQLQLPLFHEPNGRPVVPFFHPFIAPSDDASWQLSEGYSFCERARRCGFRIMADTSIRLIRCHPLS